jgi:mono/diheme cytochrome c family protein
VRARSPVLAVAALFVVVTFEAAAAQQPPPAPFAPEWAMLAGWQVYADKGCGRCHAVRGVGGGGGGPDLGRTRSGTSFFDIGAALWNHLPKMGERMRVAGVQRPRLTPLDTANVIAFIYTAQYSDEAGDAKRGEAVFAAKACVTCHRVGGRGGATGPALDAWKRANSPVLLAAAMWNHAPRMTEELKEAGTARPTLSGRDLTDIVAYIWSVAEAGAGDTQQVVPGTPDRGRLLFAEKQCARCHAVGGKGPRIGPDLGREGHHVSLTEFASRMWNHAPAMTAKMRALKIEAPQLSGQEMADIVAYLFASRYFDRTGSRARGQALVQSKGCLGCHAVAGKGATVAGDFARSTVVGTPPALVAAMWNHAAFMEAAAAKREVAWPELNGAELRDIAAYFASLSRGPGSRPAR